MAELRDVAVEDADREGFDADAQELGDGVGEGAERALEGAHGGVGDSVHGRQDERGDVGVEHAGVFIG